MIKCRHNAEIELSDCSDRRRYKLFNWDQWILLFETTPYTSNKHHFLIALIFFNFKFPVKSFIHLYTLCLPSFSFEIRLDYIPWNIFFVRCRRIKECHCWMMWTLSGSNRSKRKHSPSIHNNEIRKNQAPSITWSTASKEMVYACGYL